MTTDEKLKEIKASFRLYMDGEVSRSMRTKGVEYFVNWGVQLLRLREIAYRYDKDAELAAALWAERTRECKVLALLLMPPERMTAAVATQWVAAIPSQELAEIGSLYLFQHIVEAPRLACRWLTLESEEARICACHVLNRCVARGLLPDVEATTDIAESIVDAATTGGMGLRKAAFALLLRLDEATEEWSTAIREAAASRDLQLF